MAGKRMVVVGGDAAGMSAAAQARRRRPPEDLEIVAFERGRHTSYSACGLPYYAGDVVKDWRELVARTPEEHAEQEIQARTRHEVEAIDLEARRVRVRDLDGGRTVEEPWDVLVVATGSEPLRPPIDGIDLPGVYGLSLLQDGIELRRAIDAGPERAVIVGGGYIGLEAAEALVNRGVRTALVEAGPQVMNRVDPDMGELVSQAVRDIGVELHLEEKVEAIEGGDRVRAVRTAARTLDADLVVLGLGTRPAAGLAEAAGIELGPSGAVRVDDHQRCPGQDGVYAAGDCAESWHRLLERPVNVQLGTHANKQGRIAGTNATGGDARFPGVIGTAVSRICRYEVARTGLNEREAALTDFDVVAATIRSSTRAGYFPGAGPIWVKLVAERATGRLLGGQIVGVEGAAKRVDVLATAIWSGMTVHELELLDLAYAPPVAPVYDPLLTAASAVVRSL